MAKKPTNGGRKGTRPRQANRQASTDEQTDLAPRPAATPALTKKELARITDDAIDFVNLTLKEAGQKHELVADYLFKNMFRNDASLALDPDKNATETYRELRAHAGKSLELDDTGLSRHVRVGALNHRVRDPSWQNLRWSLKVELLPLVKGPEDELVLLRQGLRVANRLNMTVRRLRDWVENHRRKGASRLGSVTLTAGNRLVATGVELGDEEKRESLAARLNKVPAPQRREFLRDLDETIANLRMLRGSIDEE